MPLLVDRDVGSGGDTSGRQGLKNDRSLQATEAGTTNILTGIKSSESKLSTLAENISGEVMVLIPLRTALKSGEMRLKPLRTFFSSSYDGKDVRFRERTVGLACTYLLHLGGKLIVGKGASEALELLLVV